MFNTTPAIFLAIQDERLLKQVSILLATKADLLVVLSGAQSAYLKLKTEQPKILIVSDDVQDADGVHLCTKLYEQPERWQMQIILILKIATLPDWAAILWSSNVGKVELFALHITSLPLGRGELESYVERTIATL